MSKTVLITGANGFLAREVAAQAPDHWQCLGLVRRSSRMGGDATVCDSVESLLETGCQPDTVLHLAAHIPRDAHAGDPALVTANVLLPAQLLAAYPAARHVLASSVSVYGAPGSLPLRTDTPTRGSTPYAHSKLAAEHLVRLAGRYAILRFSSILGPGMRAGSFVPTALAAARGGLVTVYGDGTRRQDYIDVRDAARMCIAAAEHDDNFTTLAVAARSHSNLDIAQALAALTGAEIRFAGEDASPSFVYTLDGAIDLGPCRHGLTETLGRMVTA